VFKYLLIFLLITTSCFAGVDFDGVDDFINVSDSASLDVTSAISISIWFYTNTVSVREAPLNKYDTASERAYAININETNNGDIVAYLGYSNGDSYKKASSVGSTISISTWHHIVITWGKAVDSGKIKIFVDGSEVSYIKQESLTEDLSNVAEDIFIGKAYGSQRYFDGPLNELAIWNNDLTETEITMLSKSEKKGTPLHIKSANLIVYLPLDDVAYGTSADGTTFVDRSGTGNDGTGVDGANDSGLTGAGEEILTSPPNPNFQ